MQSQALSTSGSVLLLALQCRLGLRSGAICRGLPLSRLVLQPSLLLTSALLSLCCLELLALLKGLVTPCVKSLEKHSTRKTPRNGQTTHKTPFDTQIPGPFWSFLSFSGVYGLHLNIQVGLVYNFGSHECA